MSDFKFVDNSKKIIDAKDDAVIKALEAIGQQAVSLAKTELQKSPARIDTGLLRNSITHAVSGKAPAIQSYKGSNQSQYGKKGIPSGSYSGTAPDDPEDKKAVYVGTNVDYAVYIHEGTRHLEPNRFLKNAVDKNGKEFENIAKDHLKNA